MKEVSTPKRWRSASVRRLVVLAWLASLPACAALHGAQPAKTVFNLPADNLEKSVKRFAVQSGLEVLIPSDAMADVRTRAVRGEMTSRQALDAMLAGTGLKILQDPKTGAFALRKEATDPNGQRAALANASDRPAVPAQENPTFKPDPKNTMKKRNPIALLFGWLALGLAPADAAVAAETAPAGPTAALSSSISGRVQNSATGAYLEGALVTLEPTGQRTLTARDGSFRFASLPPGSYRISTSYTGLDSQTNSIVVDAGESVVREIALTSEIYAMEPFTVAGEREGNALAITQQRYAPNVKNVISADAFGNIADQNIGNLLMRLPGISEELEEGEITSVFIRGIASELNAVTVDGTRGASGTTGVMTRGFAIDRIPADFVERIEVTKALTPDMDGDSIGGAINLRTKSPLDRKGRHLSYMAGTSWNLYRESFRPIGSFSYSDLFGQEEKLGVLVTASYNKTHKPRDTVYQNWQAAEENPYSHIFVLGEDELEHERIGLGARVDYKLSSSHRVFLNTMHSQYEDNLSRYWLRPNPNASQIIPGWTDTVTETRNHGVTFEQDHRTRTVDTLNMVFGGEKRFETSFLDYGANYSRSTGVELRTNPRFSSSGVGFRFDRSKEIKFPTMTQISGPDIYDHDNHRITNLIFFDFDDTDIIKGAHVNWRKEFATAAPSSIKTGLRYRGQERDRVQRRGYFPFVGPDGVAGVNPATGINDDNPGQFKDTDYNYRPVDGRYAAFPALDPDLMVQRLQSNPEQFAENIVNTERDSLRNTGVVTEDVYAAYIMGDVRLGRLDVLAGVRVEETRLTGNGVRQEITPEEEARRDAWVGPVTNDELRRRTIEEWSHRHKDEGQYRNVLPSVHFKYNISDNLITRLSYSTGIGRPRFAHLLRNTTVDNDDQIVVAANPDLGPQKAQNFDLTAEYYFEPAGFISAGVFLKEIKDFIYGDRSGVVPEGPDNGFGGDYAGYELRTHLNGGSARVRGLELAYSQQLTWLPGAWRGLSLMANYTRLESEGNFSSGGGAQTGSDLPGFVPETFNAGISYAYRSWDVRLKYARRSEVLHAFSANPFLRNYRYARKNVDLNLKYNWKPWLSFYVDVINIFDDPIADTYLYEPDRVRFVQVFTTAIKAGITGRF